MDRIEQDCYVNRKAAPMDPFDQTVKIWVGWTVYRATWWKVKASQGCIEEPQEDKQKAESQLKVHRQRKIDTKITTWRLNLTTIPFPAAPVDLGNLNVCLC